MDISSGLTRSPFWVDRNPTPLWFRGTELLTTNPQVIGETYTCPTGRVAVISCVSFNLEVTGYASGYAYVNAEYTFVPPIGEDQPNKFFTKHVASIADNHQFSLTPFSFLREGEGCAIVAIYLSGSYVGNLFGHSGMYGYEFDK